jgi:hypothetical protein
MNVLVKTLPRLPSRGLGGRRKWLVPVLAIVSILAMFGGLFAFAAHVEEHRREEAGRLLIRAGISGLLGANHSAKSAAQKAYDLAPTGSPESERAKAILDRLNR